MQIKKERGRGGKRNASELKLCVVLRTFWPIESHCYKEGKGLVKRQKGDKQMQRTVCRVCDMTGLTLGFAGAEACADLKIETLLYQI